MMRLASSCLSFTGATKLTQASFHVLATSDKCWGKNGQDNKSLGDTLHKEHSMLRSLAGL